MERMTDAATIRDLSETYGKIAVSAGILAYSLGLVIVNSYLGVVGFHALGLARAEYLMAGGLYVVLVGLGSGTVVLARRTYYEAGIKESRVERFVARVIGVAMPLGIFSFLVAMATRGDRFTSISTLLFISICTVSATSFLRKEHARLSALEGTDRIPHVPWLAMLALMMQVVLLATYSFYTYRQLDRAFGGGYAPLVRIEIQPEMKGTIELVRESPVPPKLREALAMIKTPESTYHSVPTQTNRSIPLRILADTGDLYVVYVQERQSSRTFAIKKDAVTAIIPERESP